MASLSRTRTKRKIKHTRVPPKLYLELSEYASLLRSMRINDTSDLVGELIRHAKKKKDKDEINQEVNEDEYSKRRSRKRSRTQHPSEFDETVQPLPPKRRKPKRKDMYTLWPLFPEHCPIPEFSLEEEVTAVAEEWMRNRVGGRSLGTNEGEGESESENVDRPNENTAGKDDLQIPVFDPTLPTSQTNPLIPSSIMFLRTLLSTLAFHRVGSATALQSHGKPMTWIDVLEITASNGAAGLGLKDPEVIERIQTRLCEIYGDHNHSIAPQISLAISKSKTALREMDQKFQNVIFEKYTIPSRTVVSQKQSKSTESPVQDDGSDEEESDRDKSESESGSERWKEENEHGDDGFSDDDEEMGGGNGDDADDEDDEENCNESRLSDLKSGKLKSTSSSVSTPTSASQIDSDYNPDVGDDRWP